MPRKDGFSALFRHLDELVEESAQLAAEGLRPGASTLEARARATTAYQDDTGATRDGTVAYVIGGGVDDSSIIETAAGLVDAKNPGTSLVTDGDAVDADTVAVILTVPTEYEDDLETRAGGASAHLAPALDETAAALTAAAIAGLRRAFR